MGYSANCKPVNFKIPVNLFIWHKLHLILPTVTLKCGEHSIALRWNGLLINNFKSLTAP
jgi:hypothetical protein